MQPRHKRAPTHPRRQRVWLAASAFLLFALLPLGALVARAPLGSFARHLTSPTVHQAILLSLATSVAATLFGALMGLPVAWLLARNRFPGRALLATLVDLPLTLPPVVVGVGLLMAYGRSGLLGGALELLGIRVAFTTAAVVLAQTFISAPFFIQSTRAGLEAVDEELEQMALVLGADRWTAFWKVSLPLAAPAVGAGLVLAWARAMSEFGATLMFAGSLPGRTETLPLAVMGAFEVDLDAALTLSVIALIAAAMALLIARWLLRRFEARLE